MPPRPQRPPAFQAPSPLYFRGGGTVTKPHHTTSYIYPALLNRDPSTLSLAEPLNARKRRRPKGDSVFDLAFNTINNARKKPPTGRQFESWVLKEKEKDKTSENPIGRAMRRVSGFAGTTKLEMGRFEVDGLIMLYLQRTTTIALQNGQMAQDEDSYDIPEAQWWNLKVDAWPGHDSWWMRLTDLMCGTTDRAVLNVKAQLQALNLGPNLKPKDQVHVPNWPWAPREDIQQSFELVKVEEVPEEHMDCLCGDTYLGDPQGERPVKLGCGHFTCLECMEGMIDTRGVKTGKIECPFCREMFELLPKRQTIVRKDEQWFWKWKAIEDELLDVEQNLHVYTRVESLEDEKLMFDAVLVQTTITQMRNIVIYAWSLLDYGYTVDNPCRFRESVTLHKTIEDWLRHKALEGIRLDVADVENGLKTAIEEAIVPVDAYGKPCDPPEYPTNFTRYRDMLIKRVARLCCFSDQARVGLDVRVGEAKKKYAEIRQQRRVHFA